MSPLFDHPRLVDQRHPIFFSQQFPHQPLMRCHERLSPPRTLPYKMLQIPYILAQFQRDPLRRFAQQVAQQTFQVHLALTKLLDPPKRRRKLLQIRFQLWYALLHVSLRQIELGRRATIRYHCRWHGFFSPSDELSDELLHPERYHAFPFSAYSIPSTPTLRCSTMQTLNDILQDLHAIESRIRAYERKYGITSEDFYALYQQGILDDEGFEQSTEFVRWASAYSLRKKRDAAFEASADSMRVFLSVVRKDRE